jgi:hypothetical protein
MDWDATTPSALLTEFADDVVRLAEGATGSDALGEFPRHLMQLLLAHYGAALGGERDRFQFTSYGRTYTVDAVPVRDDAQQVIGVLGAAVPAPAPTGRLQRAAEFEAAADALDESADLADYCADLCRAADDPDGEERHREAAEQARRAARRARAHGFRYRSDGPWRSPDEISTTSPAQSRRRRRGRSGR